MESNCRLCSRPIKLVWSDFGEPRPLDAIPTDNGPYVVIGDMAYLLRGSPWEEVLDLQRYQSHVATCTEFLKTIKGQK